MWIERDISKELQRIIGTFPALILTGPRQIGKSSLLERIFNNFNYIALDLAGNAEMAETRPEEFLQNHAPPVLIDEVQYAPALFRHLKNAIDTRKGENGLFVLTGSQSFELMANVSDSLAGRAAVISFYSLSTKEWMSANLMTDDSSHRRFLWTGGFPALWAGSDEAPSRARWYQGYLATYLERDVRKILNVGNLRDFERFMRACASRTAQTLNMSELARDIGISATTSRQWMSALEASGQVFLLEPYYRSLGKRLAKSPKLYFTDTGLACFLAGFGDEAALFSSPMAGAFFENHVVCQWLRWRSWKHPEASLWYWRDQAGNEVDLVIEINGKLMAIECKLTASPTAKDLRGIKKMVEFYGSGSFSDRAVACMTHQTFDIEPGFIARPGWFTWE